VSVREIFRNCHREWNGFWPNGFAQDLEARLKAAGLVVIPAVPTEAMKEAWTNAAKMNQPALHVRFEALVKAAQKELAP
jgi:hypothetical protein